MGMEEFLGELERTLRGQRDLGNGYAALLGLLSRQEGVSRGLMDVVRELDFESDVEGLAEQLGRMFELWVPEETTGIYLGVDGLNMPDGKGIEVGCSTGHRAGSDDVQFIFECETYLEELDLPTLRQFFEWRYGEGREEVRGEAGLFADYVVGLGATALTFVMALGRVPLEVLLGPEVEERLVVLGFHDGDMLRLVRIRRGGIRVVLKWARF